jgi:hypothetical protein
MKRTFFKLGREFSVASRCRTEQFTLRVDVNKWIAGDNDHSPDDWHFVFDTVDEHAPAVPDEETGTTIEVRSLHATVADSFRLENFRQQLASELTDAHSVSIDRGLAITIDQLPINFLPQKLFVSATLQPAFLQKTYERETLDGKSGEPVRVKLYAGMAERDYHAGGWYVFCNGRLVLKADKGATTVWGETHSMRQYHADFAFFRGYAYFDSIHSTLLPWTTTKTGVDSDAPLYKAVQREMIEVTKPVLAFLTELARERSGDSDGDVLQTAINDAKATKIQEIPAPMPFRAPAPATKPRGPVMQRIQYSKPLIDVERAKALLKATSFKEVGERTFDYFMKYEGEA